MTRSTEFSPSDLAQLASRDLTVEAAASQLAILRTPPPPIVLDRPCTIRDGIVQLDPADHASLVERGTTAALAGRVTKFVPASGAATRMFKDLIAAWHDGPNGVETPAARQLFDQLDAFPFAEELRRRSRVPQAPQSDEEARAVLRTLLLEMRYAEIPKALIPFHRVERPRTAFEEQIREGLHYTRSADGSCRMHFTVPPEFQSAFEELLAQVRPAIEAQREGCVLSVTFSVQHPATDTLALDLKGEPFRCADGTLLFRPAGHGALLRNLEALDADLVVIKNIDNVVPDEASDEVVRWKRLLVGYLAELQASVFLRLRAVASDDCSDATVNEAVAFAVRRFARVPPTTSQGIEARREFVRGALDRPLRVCGVVRNEGEPGGAPFWVRDADGTSSVQIVEASHVDMHHTEQRRQFEAATHFNPVDVVCGVRAWHGQHFALEQFVDADTAFVSRKSFEGRDLVALERPGLWNGAMARWNTICVEVPAETFAPVKTVFDLLRPEHQRQAND